MTEVARSQLAMSDVEVDAFLRSHRWARVATTSPDGEPTISPLGYAVLDGRLYFYAMATGRRAHNIELGSRIAICVDDGVGEHDSYRDRRGVVVYGTVRVVEDGERELLDRVRSVYAASLFGDAGQDFRRRTHAWFEVDPYRRTSWDFGRIPPGRDRFA